MNPSTCVNGIIIHKSLKSKENCTMCASQGKKQEPKISAQCPRCGKTKTVKQLKFHKCKYNFKQAEEDAWEGDALHTLELIQLLKSKGYDKSCSYTILSDLKSDKKQVAYLQDKYNFFDPEDFQQYSLHKLSSIFESKYLRSENFRRIYKNHIFLEIKHVLRR